MSGYAEAGAGPDAPETAGLTRDARTAVVEKPPTAGALARVVRELLDRPGPPA